MHHFENVITSVQELKTHTKGSNQKIVQIKPRVIFEAFESKFGKLQSNSLIVPPSEIGSLTLLETTCLLCLAKLANAENIFEFGTFLGLTTANLAKNLPSNIYSLDLPKTRLHRPSNQYQFESVMTDDEINDDYLRSVQAEAGEIYLESLGKHDREKITLIKENSLEFSPLKSNLPEIGLIFIDGGHTHDVITSDTANARQMLSKQIGVIVWHDFLSNIHHEVSEYLFADTTREVKVHIQSTLLAFTCTNWEKIFGHGE